MNIIPPHESIMGLNDNLLFKVENIEVLTPIKVEILDAIADEVIGAKIYVAESEIDVSILGYVAPSLEVEPTTKNSTQVIIDNKRAMAVKLRIGEVVSGQVLVVAAKQNPEKNTVMNNKSGTLSAMSISDRIEFAVLAEMNELIQIKMEFMSNDEKILKTISGQRENDGVIIFNIDLEEIGKTQEIQNVSEVKFKIENVTHEMLIDHYSIDIVKKKKNHTRLCWRNELGGIDYYTFPYVKRRMTKIDRDKIKSGGGERIVRALVEKIIEIQSDFENEMLMEQIAYVAQSTNVWICREGQNIPVIVLNSDLIMQAQEANFLELQISLSVEEEFVA